VIGRSVVEVLRELRGRFEQYPGVPGDGVLTMDLALLGRSALVIGQAAEGTAGQLQAVQELQRSQGIELDRERAVSADLMRRMAAAEGASRVLAERVLALEAQARELLARVAALERLAPPPAPVPPAPAAPAPRPAPAPAPRVRR
jgi:hypothetical protein